jgi:hypothetical protein
MSNFEKIWNRPDRIYFKAFADIIPPPRTDAAERPALEEKREAATEIVLFEEHAASEFLRLARKLNEMERDIQDPKVASVFADYREQAIKRTAAFHHRLQRSLKP